MELKEILEQTLALRGQAFLANDPLLFPRRFSAYGDREVAALFSAALAYGRASIIRRNLEDLFQRMDNRPAEFVGNFDPQKDTRRLAGFKHRFNSGEDLACMAYLLKTMLQEAESLEAYFFKGVEDEDASAEALLTSFSRRALAMDVSPLLGRQQLPARSSVRYLFPSPATGGACKRLCMFLRWVCRPDDGIDLGLWTRLSPSRLVLPLDTHTARISRLLGLTRRRTAGWKMALEVTEALRRFDPDDPVRYDFALSHLGISEGCRGREGEVCVRCPVAGLCAVKVRGEE